ncbi:MAG: hypothetical protein UHY68_01525 [Acutalibacteraceae bacterium]|nr:hypothetical protein [Acutalibacteraceae bacterium]
MNDYVLIFITAFTILALAFIVSKLSKNQQQKFDERQQIVRGKAFTYAFEAMLIYSALYLSCSQLFEIEFLTTSVALMINIFIGLVVYGIYSIWNEAFFSLNEPPKKHTIILILAFVLNAYNAVAEIIDGKIIENGMLTLNSVTLLCAISFTIILVTMLLKIIINKKAEQEG